MKLPKIGVIPLRPAVRSDAPVTLDVLVRITPPESEQKIERPALNLGLVIDRSGSMEGDNKIGYAREAAVFAVQQLLPSDRVSVTVFDDQIETLVTNRLAENKRSIIDVIKGIVPRGSTALHGGWQEGAKQVAQTIVPGALNRVLLLSDGLANAGETNADVIATDVHRQAKNGVSTTTLGLGADYNEDLLEAMALSGDGNYYFIESPHQLNTIFGTELKGLMATTGKMVSLGCEPHDGVSTVDVLNDLETLPTGRLKLPNLLIGIPVILVLRLNVLPRAETGDICTFRLAWNAPDSEERQSVRETLRLPAVDASSWGPLAANVEVQEHAILLRVARYKKQATVCLDRGEYEQALQWLEEAKGLLATAPSTPEINREAQDIAMLVELWRNQSYNHFRKSASYQTHMRRRSRTIQSLPRDPNQGPPNP
jgi:Ca-activated chloride channel family protein